LPFQIESPNINLGASTPVSEWGSPFVFAQAERQRQATRPGLAVRGTFSPVRAWRPTVGASLARTLN
jgi:hypothetical protein